jgi:hypothetical protein
VKESQKTGEKTFDLVYTALALLLVFARRLVNPAENSTIISSFKNHLGIDPLAANVAVLLIFTYKQRESP